MKIMPERMLVGTRSMRLLRDPIRPQLADHELAEGVVEVRRIISASRRLLACVAGILEGLFA